MLRKETKRANELLRKRKQELLSIESILETRHAMKRYSPEALGQGKARSGGVAARRLRYEVLDKMAKLGTGLTPSQKNDWAWFREAWDEKMCGEHAQEWGGTFSQWMQKFLMICPMAWPTPFQCSCMMKPNDISARHQCWWCHQLTQNRSQLRCG